MSVPYIAWAFAQRGLTPARRVVLIALCERANGLGTCFPSEAALAEDCELSRRAVIDAVHYLRAERGLIAIVTNPVEREEILRQAGARTTTRANVYRILRPIDGANSAHSSQPDSANPARSSNVVSAKFARSTSRECANASNRVCKKQQIEGAKSAHEPLKEPFNEPRGAQARPNQARIFSITNEPPPSGEPQPEDDNPPVDPGVALAVLDDLKRSLRMRAYPPRAAVMSPDEMATAACGMAHVRPAYLPDAMLAALRADARRSLAMRAVVS